MLLPCPGYYKDICREFPGGPVFSLARAWAQSWSNTVVFSVALFTIAGAWKQPKCPSTEEWIKKMWYIYTMEYYSTVKKGTKFVPLAATWMGLKIVILNEVS